MAGIRAMKLMVAGLLWRNFLSEMPSFFGTTISPPANSIPPLRGVGGQPGDSFLQLEDVAVLVQKKLF